MLHGTGLLQSASRRARSGGGSTLIRDQSNGRRAPTSSSLVVRLFVLGIFKNSNWSAHREVGRVAHLLVERHAANRTEAHGVEVPEHRAQPVGVAFALLKYAARRLADVFWPSRERRGSWYVAQTAHTHAISALSSTCQAAAAAARSFSSPLSHVGVGVDATHMLRAVVQAAAKTLPRPHAHTSVRGLQSQLPGAQPEP